MYLIFYGPEGSGKGTQAKLLNEKLKLPMLTSGDLVREASAHDRGIIGETCRRSIRVGHYVPDSEMFVMWKRRLKQKDARNGWIMDGFPRNLHQAKFLNAKIAKYGYKLDRVFYLNIPEKESYRRLLARARPLHEGSKVLHDTPRRIKNRLAFYNRNAPAVLDYYRKKGILVEINADQAIRKVHQAITKHLPVQA